MGCRAINPYLGVLTGWLVIAAYIVGTVAEVLLLGPSVEFVRGDPFVLHGVVRNWTIREWDEALIPETPWRPRALRSHDPERAWRSR
jgi:amino acid transporter